MVVRFEGNIAVVMPVEPEPSPTVAQELEQCLRDQLLASRSVVIDGNMWREIDGPTRSVLIDAQAVFNSHGLHFKIACVDRAVQNQLNPASSETPFIIEHTVQLAVAFIERTTIVPAASP